MFQWVLPFKEQNKVYSKPTLLYFANSAVGAAALPPRLMHAHDDRVEITYVLEGSGVYIINNRKYRIQKGDVIVIEPNQVHDEKRDENENLTVYCCGITGIWFPGLGRNHILPEGVSPILHSGKTGVHIENIFMCIFEQLLLKTEKEAIAVGTKLSEVIVYLVRQMEMKKEAAQDQERPEFAQRIKTYLDKHYNEAVSLDIMADYLHMSTSYLAHTFKNATGYSPGQYMIWRRIGEAQTLLITTDYPVTQIATMVGYDNTNYFSSLFKKSVAMRPKEYRKYWVGNA